MIVESEEDREQKDRAHIAEEGYPSLTNGSTPSCRAIVCVNFTVTFLKCYHRARCVHKRAWGPKQFICTSTKRREYYDLYEA